MAVGTRNAAVAPAVKVLFSPGPTVRSAPYSTVHFASQSHSLTVGAVSKVTCPKLRRGHVIAQRQHTVGGSAYMHTAQARILNGVSV